MKQLVQNYKTGKLSVIEAPTPIVRPGGVLVRTVRSAVSVGSERTGMEFAGKSLLGKARARPYLARQVLEMARNEGPWRAYTTAVNRLDTLMPLGYSSAGLVVEVGQGVEEFRVRDRVACARSGFASHSEIVFVPADHCVRVPDGVDFDSAAFCTPAAVALHAVRTCQVAPGGRLAIVGVGLLGLIGVQVAGAMGIETFAVDVAAERVALARELGAEAGAVVGEGGCVANALAHTGGKGFDAVLILAASSSNEPLEMAAEICGRGGRIVATGLIRLDVPRDLFYQKELSLTVSRDWGPETNGRGDDAVPTGRENMLEALGLMEAGRLNISRLITDRMDISEAAQEYPRFLMGDAARHVGCVITYDERTGFAAEHRVDVKAPLAARATGRVNLGMVGAGTFALGTILPVVKGLPSVRLRGVATASGHSAKHAADKFGFEYCTTDYREVILDPDVQCVLIATRHDLHASIAAEAVRHGKYVFVEKPLALSLDDLRTVTEAYRESEGRLMVGFNRRFSRFSVRARELLCSVSEPLAMLIRVNAGYIPADSWVHDPQQGGGRILGETCHFVDLAQFLAGARPVKVTAQGLGEPSRYLSNENVAAGISMEDGSVASILYVANGDMAFPRERVEVFGGGAACVIDNFRSLVFSRDGSRTRMWRLNKDAGHRTELAAFFDAVLSEKEMPVPFEEYVHSTVATIAVVRALAEGGPVDVTTMLPVDVAA